MIFGPRIELKTPEELQLMHRAGQLTHQVLSAARSAAVAGANTAEVDVAAVAVIVAAVAQSIFKGYMWFPADSCSNYTVTSEYSLTWLRTLSVHAIVSSDLGVR